MRADHRPSDFSLHPSILPRAMTWTMAMLWLFLASAALAEWRPVAPGVDHQNIVRGEIDVHVARIDLMHPDTRVIATSAGERGLTVSDFAARTDATVAVNGDYFDEKLWPIGKSAGACGLWWRGKTIQRNQGLVTVGAGRAEIQTNTQKVRPWARGAVSGWPLIVADCAPVAALPGSDFFTRAPHPRTAVALSADGKTMFLVVADGRRPGVPGMTLPELAEFLVTDLGACRAMNLDGGGSSAMWVGDRIVNRPSDGPERRVGNHLAVVRAADYSGCRKQKRKTKR
jgi:exopolysaccharide biosynthesis protein